MLAFGSGGRRLMRFALLVALMAALPAAVAFAAPEETASPQIYYGQDADEGEYPYAAYVESPIGSCTGTLVSAAKVLTAAHCVEGLEATPAVFTVGLGSRDLNDQDTYGVGAIDRHADYDPVTLENDVAMLTLDAAAPETPLRVIDTNETAQWEPGDILRIAGWGEMEDQNFPDILQEANVPRIDDTACDTHYGGDVDPATMVCAGDGTAQSPQEDTCQGDSGGPLMATDANGALTLMGVTSWGGDCGEGPGVYARIGSDPLNDWVKDRLAGGPPPPTPPANDAFASSTAMSGNVDTEADQSNANATKEAGEPEHAGDSGGKSVWYSWQAPANGQVIVDTCDTDFDTLLGVYTGNSVGALSEIASSDDDCGLGSGSSASFTAQQGQTYRFAVDGFEGDSGTFDIHLELTADGSDPPPNDAFANAIGMSGNLDSELNQNNTNATKESGEPNHAGNPGGKSLWYSWTAPADGDASVDTCDVPTSGGAFDTIIGVYTGSSVSSLTPVTSDDDSCIREGGSFAAFSAQAGQTYRFAVDGYGGDSGRFDIYVELTPADGGGDGGGGGGGGGGGTTNPPPPAGASAGNNTLFGNGGNNVICGLGGSDLIRGLGGNDTLFGDQCGARSQLSRAAARAAAADDGNDRLFGDAGNDRLFGSGRNDRLFGGPGNDLLVGGRGRDSLSGGGGRDTINSRDRARDVVNCGPGRDTVRRDRRDRVRGCERVRR